MTEDKFNEVIGRYVTDGTMDCEEYEVMDYRQKTIIQTLKRAFKRLKAKQNKNDKVLRS